MGGLILLNTFFSLITLLNPIWIFYSQNWVSTFLSCMNGLMGTGQGKENKEEGSFQSTLLLLLLPFFGSFERTGMKPSSVTIIPSLLPSGLKFAQPSSAMIIKTKPRPPRTTLFFSPSGTESKHSLPCCFFVMAPSLTRILMQELVSVL